MFPNTSVEELSAERIYAFDRTDPVYLKLMAYYAALFDRDYAKDDWRRYDMNSRNHKFWWVMNESWKAYGEPNPDIPVHWLAISKRALQLDHMPSNFHAWALPILEKFDLPRYQAAYHLPPEEYELIAHDLPIVLQGLRDYPRDKLAPSIDETNWGYNDQ